MRLDDLIVSVVFLSEATHAACPKPDSEDEERGKRGGDVG